MQRITVLMLLMAMTVPAAQSLETSPYAALPALRPPAVPLVTIDPFFSVWSAADRLTDTNTTHWSGAEQPVSLLLVADGAQYRLLGKDPVDVPALPQIATEVRPTQTVCSFAKDALRVEVRFSTPAMPEDLDVFSRPVTYVTVRVKGAGRATVSMTLSPQLATNDDRAPMLTNEVSVAGLRAIRVGRRDQTPLSQAGDRVRCDWGWAWLVGPAVTDGETHFLLAYDDVKSIRFIDRDCEAWWRRGGKRFETMLAEAEADYPALMRKMDAFDAQLTADLVKLGGGQYARLASLAYRQSFAACKLVAGPAGEALYFSKENASNGCIGTVDVFYPQLPQLLLLSPALVEATLRPIMLYASSTNWPYAFAPHDVGQYPLAVGQCYRMDLDKYPAESNRMPVEECGNMLLCLGALAHLDGNADFAGRWWPLVTRWAEYLQRIGFDPGDQLCTDDFAGHLAHNANLSVKTILALAAYARLAEARGEREAAASYRKLATEMAAKWLEAAQGGRAGGYRLAFNQSDTWSLKYNLVWDRILGFNLFPREVAEKEMRAYRQLLQTYGLPLDGRKNYTKADWTVWAATLTGRRDDFEAVIDRLYRFVNETPDRLPWTDWYWTDTGKAVGSMYARSVIGGVFMPALCDQTVWHAWSRRRSEK